MAGRQRTVVTREVLSEEELAAQRSEERAEMLDANEGVTIFELGDIDEKRIDKVHVIRKDPPEGFLGEVEPNVTENDIFSRWGGSEYRIEGKNTRGQVCKVKTLKIAGNPVFISEIWEARWRRSNGLSTQPGAPAAAPVGEQLTIKDVLLMMDERDARRRAEEQGRAQEERRSLEEREERRRRDEAERDERRRKDEAEREDRRKREETERADKERKGRLEDEERRRAQHAQDMERMTAQMSLSMQQQAQMFQNTIEMLKVEASGKKDVDQVGLLTKGVELAMALHKPDGDGEGGGVVGALLGRLPETLRELRETGQAVASEVRGRGKGGEGGGGPGEPLVIHGPLAEKLKAAALKLQAAGQNPEVVLANLADSIVGGPRRLPRRRGPGKKTKAAAAAPARPITPAGPRAVG